MKTLDLLLAIIAQASAAVPLVTNNTDATQAAKLADALIKIAQTASAAYEREVGEPIDLSKVGPLPLID